MDRYAYFVSQILKWHQRFGRHDLPWRKTHRTLYEVWVSEVMLQQTQVSRVIDYYKQFLEKFPTVELLATTSWVDFLPYYQGLGYYNRGRNMLKTAQIITQEYNGHFPKTKAELIKLPGIGEYTATAILSFGYGQSHLAFDTNQQRVWGRYLFGDKKATVNVQELEQHLPKETDFNQLNSAIMDFANLVYKNNSVDIENSPLKKYCVYCQTEGKYEVILFRPVRRDFGRTRKPKATSQKMVQTILLLHQNHQVYFSENSKEYQPFYLPVTVNSRPEIKKYFEEKYDLQVAIRPPFQKQNVDGVMTQLVRAQILLGDHLFGAYSKAEATAWLDNQFKNSAQCLPPRLRSAAVKR